MTLRTINTLLRLEEKDTYTSYEASFIVKAMDYCENRDFFEEYKTDMRFGSLDPRLTYTEWASQYHSNKLRSIVERFHQRQQKAV